MDPADVVGSLVGVAVAGGVGYAFVRLIIFGYRRLGRRIGGGTAQELEDLRAHLSEEHAHLVGEGLADLRPGARLELIPSHGDTTLNMHDAYYVRRGDEVIDTWPILAARKFR